jgi:hypothetical protein
LRTARESALDEPWERVEPLPPIGRERVEPLPPIELALAAYRAKRQKNVNNSSPTPNYWQVVTESLGKSSAIILDELTFGQVKKFHDAATEALKDPTYDITKQMGSLGRDSILSAVGMSAGKGCQGTGEVVGGRPQVGVTGSGALVLEVNVAGRAGLVVEGNVAVAGGVVASQMGAPGSAPNNGGDANNAENAPATPLRRPYIRQGVRAEVEARAPRTADGRFIDPNTGEPINGTPDLGHRPGHEFWREQARAQQEGLTQQQFNDRMNNPDLYQLENPRTNRGHGFEQPR